MAKPVLVVHGAGEPRKRGGKIYWESLLGAALGRKYRIVAPRMPKPEEPSYDAWSARLEQLLKEHASPVLVGHSLGASIILKYLAETERRPQLTGVFLAATPWWGSDFPEFALSKGARERLSDLSPLYLYQSQDDPEVPPSHLDKYRRLLPQATVRLLDGRGHEFNQPEFPELVADIQAVCA